ncbi:MAG: 23S rRNA (uracil(1939)-C(5))-methyltransferase RlmD, partial [Desulfobaccales bacterium]
MTTIKDPTTAPPFFEGMELELAVEKLAFGGKALGRVGGFVVFVDHGLPGQTLRAKITRKKAQFAEARVIELLSQSPAYEPPFCPHFGLCGGCQWQDLAYEEQLHWKGVHVQECLKHLAGLGPRIIQPAVASPHQRHYRNKMEFSFAPGAWVEPQEAAAQGSPGNGCALGLHVGHDPSRIFNLEHCFLQSAQSPAIVQEVRRWCEASRLPAYNPKTRQGFWRFLVVREGKRTSETLVHIITTAQGDKNAVDKLAGHLQSRFPGITTLVHSQSRKKAQVATGEVSRTLFGPGYIEEKLGQLRFQISAQSFFQPNTLAAEGLYAAISGLAELTGQETVWDLYCGAGGIGLSVAAQVRRVVGFELMAAALADAVTNCRLNGI